MEYAVLIYGDETTWQNADAATRAAMYADHTEFTRLLGEHGHKMTGGAELRGTTTAKTVRGTTDSFAVTDGPFAETTEQLGGLYLVDTDDVDDLYRLVAMLSHGESIEIRPLVNADDRG